MLCLFIYLLGIVKVFSSHYSWQGDLSCRPNFPELNEKQITVLEKNSNLNLILEGTVWPDWICMRVVPLDEPLHTKIHLILLLIGITGCMVTSRNLFRQTGPKMRKSQQLVFGLQLVRRIFAETLRSRNQNQNNATLWRIFSSNKGAPANRKKRFYTNRNLNSEQRRLGFFFV